MPFTEDLTAFLDDDDFATAAVFSRGGATVNVIFDARYQDPLGIESAAPRAVGREADFAGIVPGDTLTLNSIAYSIRGHEPDGTGMIAIRLREPS